MGDETYGRGVAYFRIPGESMPKLALKLAMKQALPAAAGICNAPEPNARYSNLFRRAP